MRERLLSFVMAILLGTGIATAQTQISGGIVSEEDGGPLVGATIMAVGTKSGTVTDVNGRFVLNVKEGTELKISCLGMKPKIVKAKANLNVVLEPDENMLTDVVVTAMGISREKKALGYAVSDLGGEEMVKSRGGLNNPVNALQGKVAGLQISSGSGWAVRQRFLSVVSTLSQATTNRFSLSTVCRLKVPTTTQQKRHEAEVATTTVTSYRTSTPTT